MAGQSLPIINVRKAANAGCLMAHPTGEQMINQQHSINRQATAFSQARGREKSSRKTVTNLEVPAHLGKGATPSSGNSSRSSNQDRKTQGRISRNAVDALLQVS